MHSFTLLLIYLCHDRADKIDQALETQDQHYLKSLKERHARKEHPSHENFIKKLITMKVKNDTKK